MKKRISTIILTTFLVLMLATMSFAGSWEKVNFSKEDLGTGFGSTSYYITPEVVTSGNPGVYFYVLGGSSGDTIKVEMQRKDYVSGEGWVFQTVSTTTRSINSSYSYVDFWDSSVWFSNDECRFKITPDARSVDISGYVDYYTN